MENPPPVPQKKGLGSLAWVGIGCGSLVILGIIAFAILGVTFGSKVKQFADEAQKNPTRLVATTMVSVGSGQMEMISEDDANKRYTVRAKSTGKLTTIYWSEKKHTAEIIEGDFSAIPGAEGEPSPALPSK